jgi:hypothetical protein
MAPVSARPEKENRDEWFERKVMHYGVEFRGIRFNSDVLANLRQRRASLRVAVRLDKPDASAILVRVPRRKSILSVLAVSPVALPTSKEGSW